MGRAVERSIPIQSLSFTNSDEDEDDKPLLPEKQAIARHSMAARWACAAMAALYVCAYAWSLQGGSHSRDLRWINQHMAAIGGALATSVVAFTAAVWATVAMQGSQQRRSLWAVGGGLLTLNLLFLVYDHGNDFQYHGYYNWLVFAVIAVPLNVVLASLYLWYSAMTPRRFAASFIGSGALFAAVVAISLVRQQHLWYRGFFGHTMALGCPGGSCNGTVADCSYPSNLPWVDLPPAGAQNFWTAWSQHCQHHKHFKVDFNDKGLLTIRGCHHLEHMSYTQIPSTRHWPAEWKVYKKASFQSHVLSHMKPEPYTGPVKLKSEAVLARCGPEEELLVRVRRLRSRSAPEPPLASLVRSSSSGGSSGSGGGSSEAGIGSKGGAGGGKGDLPGSSAAAAVGSPKLNVMILFLDSVSRRHFFRRLGRTAAAMEAIHRSKRAELYQFFRYHTVGFSTDPNTHAMYTGTSFPHAGATPVWQAYRKAGYVSGSAYNLCEGWGADYNERATRHDHELVAPYCDPEYHPVTPDGEPYKIFKGAFSILRRCMRGRYVHAYNFDYMRSFLRAYHGVTPFFLLGSFHEGHEGTGEVLSTMDGDLAEFLEDLTPKQLNSTLVFVLSDHGLTMGLNFLFAENGKVEHKNPFLAMLAPTWLPTAYPQLAAALRGNEQRLFSAFDIHTTLHHVLHLGSGNDNPAATAAAASGGPKLPSQYPSWAAFGNVSEAVQWGISLMAPIPAGRSCDEAAVPPDNCMCHLP